MNTKKILSITIALLSFSMIAKAEFSNAEKRRLNSEATAKMRKFLDTLPGESSPAKKGDKVLSCGFELRKVDPEKRQFCGTCSSRYTTICKTELCAEQRLVYIDRKAGKEDKGCLSCFPTCKENILR